MLGKKEYLGENISETRQGSILTTTFEIDAPRFD